MPHKLDVSYLEQLREENQLTYQEVADISGVPIGSVKRILSGNTDNPSACNVADIVDALGGSMDDAFGIRIQNTIIPNTEIETRSEISIITTNPLERALESSRSSYQNAYDSIQRTHKEQIDLLQKILNDKNTWIRWMFAYCVVLTAFVGIALICRK